MIVISNKSFSQDCTSRVVIKNNNPEAAVFINHKFIGNGNLELDLKKGDYIIQVKEEKSGWSNSLMMDSISITSCDEKFNLSFNMQDMVYLSSNPPDVRVLFGDSLVGYTPLFLSNRFNSLKLEKNNYESVIINLNGENNLSFNLKEIERKNGVSFLKSNLFKILLGSALVFGGTAAYFKLQADDNFELYNKTKDDKYLKKTDRYDLVSGIAFGALQINFGFLIYYFLTD